MILVALFSSTYSWGYLMFYVIAILLFARTGFKLQLGSVKKYYWLYFIPNVVIFIHAISTVAVYHETFHLSRAFNNFVYILMCILSTYSLYYLHKKRSIEIILNAIFTYYLYNVAVALFSVGFVPFVTNIVRPGSTLLTKWLEQHDIGLSLGLIIIYYIFFNNEHTKSKRRYLICSIIVFVLCSKRIALGALAAVCIFKFFYGRRLDKRGRLTLIWGIAGVIICLAFVYTVSNEYILGWLWNHGINTMGRTNIYRTFRPYYEFSPTFYGRGSGFTAKTMSLWAGTQMNAGGILALHSDILRAFIEYGFIGSILWYAYYLIFLPRKIASRYEKYSEVVFVIAIYSFIVYLTDNTSSYMLFQTFYMLIPLCSEAKQNKRIKKLLHKKEFINA